MTKYAIHAVVNTDATSEAIKDPADTREADAYGIYTVNKDGTETWVSDSSSPLLVLEGLNDLGDVSSVEISAPALRDIAEALGDLF